MEFIEFNYVSVSDIETRLQPEVLVLHILNPNIPLFFSSLGHIYNLEKVVSDLLFGFGHSSENV